MSDVEQEWRPSWAVLAPGHAAPPSRPRAEVAAARELRERRRQVELRRAQAMGRVIRP